MAMSTARRAGITVALLAAFGGALFFALRGQQQERVEQQAAAEVASTVALKVLIALDVEPYFKDERVKRGPNRPASAPPASRKKPASAPSNPPTPRWPTSSPPSAA